MMLGKCFLWGSTPSLAISSCNCVDAVLMLFISHQEYQVFVVSVNLMLMSRKSFCQELFWMFLLLLFFLGEVDFSVNYLKNQS